MFGYASSRWLSTPGDRNTVVMSETGTGSYFTTLGCARRSPHLQRVGRGWAGRRPVRRPQPRGMAAPLRGRPVDRRAHSQAQRRPLQTVIGVAPAEFTGLSRVIVRISGSRALDEREAAARVRRPRRPLDERDGAAPPGASLAEAQAEAETVGKRLQREYPVTNRTRESASSGQAASRSCPGWSRSSIRRRSPSRGGRARAPHRQPRNVANMLLAARRCAGGVRRSASRWRPRGRIVRQLLVESPPSRARAAAGGLMLGIGATRAAGGRWGSLQLPTPSPSRSARRGGRVLAYTIGLAVVTTLAFGLAPALDSFARRSRRGLKERRERRLPGPQTPPPVGPRRGAGGPLLVLLIRGRPLTAKLLHANEIDRVSARTGS